MPCISKRLCILIGLLIAGATSCTSASEYVQTVLLYSNSPEKVVRPSFLYSSQINGPARLLFHHVNKTGAPLLLEVTLTNVTSLSGGIAWRLYQYQHTDPTQAGHYAVKQFWQDKQPIYPNLLIPAYSEYPAASLTWNNGSTISGIAWIYAAQPTQVNVIAKPLNSPFTLPATPLSSTVFPLADLSDDIPYTLPRGPVVFSIGRGNFLDNTSKVLHGNYGVLHRYRILAANPTTNKQLLRIYSRQAGGFSKAFVQIDGELLPIPTSTTYEKLLLTTRVLPPQSETVITLATMPQPGSNMPIDFILESGGVQP